MELFSHNLTSLFEQLGLDSSPQAINLFVTEHKLRGGENLHDATFWQPSQQRFLSEALNEDADWAEAIDLLDTLLRKTH
ncbi:DUF2789 domain-containing protein [Thaumasiovibrio subtropicus]|uniref:DUF2789 domain-containing protein n=1 Tax=Thaumasiovibrio subtropicus TaxID=1891207 RepID=UPI000B355D28|nr:DUF2789 domain-containing protein [Thaumasiovibrio subtropicus]